MTLPLMMRRVMEQISWTCNRSDGCLAEEVDLSSGQHILKERKYFTTTSERN